MPGLCQLVVGVVKGKWCSRDHPSQVGWKIVCSVWRLFSPLTGSSKPYFLQHSCNALMACCMAQIFHLHLHLSLCWNHIMYWSCVISGFWIKHHPLSQFSGSQSCRGYLWSGLCSVDVKMSRRLKHLSYAERLRESAWGRDGTFQYLTGLKKGGQRLFIRACSNWTWLQTGGGGLD